MAAAVSLIFYYCSFDHEVCTCFVPALIHGAVDPHSSTLPRIQPWP